MGRRSETDFVGCWEFKSRDRRSHDGNQIMSRTVQDANTINNIAAHFEFNSIQYSDLLFQHL